MLPMGLNYSISYIQGIINDKIWTGPAGHFPPAAPDCRELRGSPSMSVTRPYFQYPTKCQKKCQMPLMPLVMKDWKTWPRMRMRA